MGSGQRYATEKKTTLLFDNDVFLSCFWWQQGRTPRGIVKRWDTLSFSNTGLSDGKSRCQTATRGEHRFFFFQTSPQTHCLTRFAPKTHACDFSWTTIVYGRKNKSNFPIHDDFGNETREEYEINGAEADRLGRRMDDRRPVNIIGTSFIAKILEECFRVSV